MNKPNKSLLFFFRKYYEKIKQKHRNYINNLLRASQSPSIIEDEPMIVETNENSHQNEHENDYKTPAKDPFDEMNAYASIPIPLPNINANRNIYAKKEVHDGIVNNTFVGRNHAPKQSQVTNQFNGEISNEFLEITPKHSGKNVTNILELLRSQIIRRRKRIQSVKHQNINPYQEHEWKKNEKFHRVKRRAPKTDISLTSLPQLDEDNRDSDGENGKNKRPKEPCEVSFPPKIFF